MQNKPAVLVSTLLTLGLACGDTADDDAHHGDPTSRTFTIPFTAEFGGRPLVCGETYANAGTSAASFALKDLMLFIHGVELVRQGGERVPLQLVDDQQWQGQGVTLLDFNDGTGSCIGDADTNDRIVGTAADHDDYVGIAFVVGLPPALNHLNAVTAPAPLNKPSTWWSWTGGYKFLQMTVETDAHDSYYVHIGSTNCEGSVDEGFSCASTHEMAIDLAGFTPGVDGIRINVATMFSELDLNAPLDDGSTIAGCMSFEGNSACDPLFRKFGRNFMSEDPAPEQIAFESLPGMAEGIDAEADADATPQPGHPDFPRSPALDMSRVSERGGIASHPPGNVYPIGSLTHDRSPGSQCMSCHQSLGPGLGLFDVAGTIFAANGVDAYPNATVKLLPVWAGPCGENDAREHCEDQPVGYYREEDVIVALETDARGNFYTTDLPAGVEPPFWPIVEAEDGLAPRAMRFPTSSGACNMCHGISTGIRIRFGE